MATTTNYGWTTPDDTDLVKDGAAAIRTLGSSVDTTTKNLNPETTLGDISFRSATSNVNTRLPIGSSGQHLTVVAGVPAWATVSDQTPLTTKGDLFTFSTVDARLGVGTNDHRLVAASGEATGLKYVADTQNTVIDAEGDLLVGDAADALQRLAIGSNDQVLTVDTTVDGKIKWATPAGYGKVLQVVQGLKTDSTTTTSQSFIATGVTLTITPTANTSKILILSTINVSGSASTQPLYKLVKDSTTDLFVGDAAGNRPTVSGQTFTSNDNYMSTGNLMFLDSPATTSATTYEIYWRAEAASTVGLNRTVADNNTANYGVRTASSIIALEIGA